MYMYMYIYIDPYNLADITSWHKRSAGEEPQK